MKTTTATWRTIMAKQFRPTGRIKLTMTSGFNVWQFREDDLTNLAVKMAADPLSRRLPQESLVFSVLDFSGAYDPSNPDGKWAAMDENAMIQVAYGIQNGASIIWLEQEDVFFLKGRPSWQRGVATFQATSQLLHMTGTYYKGTTEETTLYDLAAAVFTDAGVSSFSIDPSLMGYTTSAPAPVDTHRNTLQKIAQAAGCALFTRHGTITIAPVDLSALTDHAYTMTLRDLVMDEDIVTKTQPIYQVEAYRYAYTEEPQTSVIYEQVINATGGETIHLEFNTACKDATITASSGTIISSAIYARAADIVMQDPGIYLITVTGKKVTQSGTFLRSVVGTDRNGGTFTINNPLITTDGRRDAAMYLAANYLRNRITHTMMTRGNPDQEPLDGLNFATEYNFAAYGMIAGTELTFDGAYAGKIEVLSLNEGTDGEAAKLIDSDDYDIQDSAGDQVLVVGAEPYKSAYTAQDMDDFVDAVNS